MSARRATDAHGSAWNAEHARAFGLTTVLDGLDALIRLAMAVDDLEDELARLQAEGVVITMPLSARFWRATPTA